MIPTSIVALAIFVVLVKWTLESIGEQLFVSLKILLLLPLAPAVILIADTAYTFLRDL